MIFPALWLLSYLCIHYAVTFLWVLIGMEIDFTHDMSQCHNSMFIVHSGGNICLASP